MGVPVHESVFQKVCGVSEAMGVPEVMGVPESVFQKVCGVSEAR
jgi:hypothetical protein